MKNIFLTLVFLSVATVSAQVKIGDASPLSSSSVSLEFASGNKGMILPWVTSETSVTDAVNGTIIFDLAAEKIKVKKKAAGWIDLTMKNKTDVVTGIPNKTVDASLQNGLVEQPNAKTLIGGNAQTDTTKGILVLGDTNKAMILPKVAAPHINIKEPAAGMMVYDTAAKQLAVFNGTVWTFWKAE